jgi:hypothetical protein
MFSSLDHASLLVILFAALDMQRRFHASAVESVIFCLANPIRFRPLHALQHVGGSAGPGLRFRGSRSGCSIVLRVL